MHVEILKFCSVLLSIYFLFLNPNENWLLVFTKYCRQVTNKFGKDAREEFGAAPQGAVFLCFFWALPKLRAISLSIWAHMWLVYDLSPPQQATWGSATPTTPTSTGCWDLALVLGPTLSSSWSSVRSGKMIFQHFSDYWPAFVSVFCPVLQNLSNLNIWLKFMRSTSAICTSLFSRDWINIFIEEVFKGSKVPPKLFK